MTELQLTRDIKGQIAYGINFTQDGSIGNFTAGSTPSLIVPAEANFALFQFTPGASVLVGNSATPIPAPGAAFIATLSNEDISPAGRSVIPGETIQFNVLTDSLIKVSFYKV